VNNFDIALRTRQAALTQKPEFVNFIKKFKENSEVVKTGNGGFENIHIMPVQRVRIFSEFFFST
jgi:hypothetical protein